MAEKAGDAEGMEAARTPFEQWRSSRSRKSRIPDELWALARRGWTIAVQVREVNSGAARRSPRESTGSRSSPPDRHRPGLAAGSLGAVGNRSAGDVPRTCPRLSSSSPRITPIPMFEIS
jgi:hypothetical protein